MLSNLIFPQSPPVIAEWQPIFLEPIVDSGERITILIILKDINGEVHIHRTIDENLLKTLYVKKYNQINGLIDYIENTISQSPNWEIPFEGIYPGAWFKSADFSLDGIIKQALSLTSSLSIYANHLDEISKPKVKNTSRWLDDVKDIVIQSNPNLTTSFDRQIPIAKNISYTYSFNYNSFVANLLDFRNINQQKAQTSIFQMQLLSKNKQIKNKEFILQMPTTFDLEEMTVQKKDNLNEKIIIFSELLSSHDVKLVRVETAEEASKKLLQMVG